jgi:hypothetical protein
MEIDQKGKLIFNVSKIQIEEAVERARKQESIYGHNTGHFTLGVEKENTIIGVLGEIIVRDLLTNLFKAIHPSSTLKLGAYGAKFDLELSTQAIKNFLHVKSGLWKSWPQQNWHFGVHADQGIQNSQYPLILVSFLKSNEFLPDTGRIEGFISSEKLRNSKSIKRGQPFPSTGVISRTDNILTTFSDYQPIIKLSEFLDLK